MQNKPIWDIVIEDMKARHQKGMETYGVPLTAHNGRNALQDAYEEALDLAAYLKQALIEQQHKHPLSSRGCGKCGIYVIPEITECPQCNDKIPTIEYASQNPSPNDYFRNFDKDEEANNIARTPNSSCQCDECMKFLFQTKA